MAFPLRGRAFVLRIKPIKIVLTLRASIPNAPPANAGKRQVKKNTRR